MTARPALSDPVRPDRPNGQDWAGQARMADARRAAGVPLNRLDTEALTLAGIDAPTIRSTAGPAGSSHDWRAGKARRDDALARVEEHADPTWLDRAKVAIARLAEEVDTLTGDDLWRYVEKPAEPRAAGVVFRWARTQGLIEPTGEFVPTTQATSHASPSRVWKSLRRGEG